MGFFQLLINNNMKRMRFTSLILVIIFAIFIPQKAFNEKLLEIGFISDSNNSSNSSKNLILTSYDTFKKDITSGIKSFIVWVTAYASVPEQTDDTPLITASNKLVRDGIVAANFLPFGTKIKIPSLFGDRVFVVEDRMKKGKDDYIDVWMPDANIAKNFGVHRTKIVVLEDAGVVANANE